MVQRNDRVDSADRWYNFLPHLPPHTMKECLIQLRRLSNATIPHQFPHSSTRPRIHSIPSPVHSTTNSPFCYLTCCPHCATNTAVATVTLRRPTILLVAHNPLVPGAFVAVTPPEADAAASLLHREPNYGPIMAN